MKSILVEGWLDGPTPESKLVGEHVGASVPTSFIAALGLDEGAIVVTALGKSVSVSAGPRVGSTTGFVEGVAVDATKVGDEVGPSSGRSVGTVDGAVTGALLGFMDNESDGEADGAVEGLDTGRSLGSDVAVGCSVGRMLGSFDRDPVASAGGLLGMSDGPTVGA